MTRVVFLGGKEVGFFCLNHLLTHGKQLGIEVIGVLTSNKSISGIAFSFQNLCEEYSVPMLNNLNDLVDVSDVDILISVQYHLILSQEHIAKVNQIAINLHMAPLPEYRGCNQFSFAILDGVSEFGTTIHKLEESIDGGDLIAERRFKVVPNIFVKDLYDIALKESKLLFIQNIKAIIDDEITLIPQIDLPQERARGFHLRNEMEAIKQIDASWPVEQQKRHFRATYFPPFPPPVLVKGSEEIELDMNWYNSV
ncbi:MAG: hypothetical protein JKY53_09350 [Flavobacteriales bacterium]|nr:hypothetical protein [Flavobacteriales bacterium]